MIPFDSRAELVALRGGILLLTVTVGIAFALWLTRDLLRMRRGERVNINTTLLSLGIALTWGGSSLEYGWSALFNLGRKHGGTDTDLAWMYPNPVLFLGLGLTACGALLHIRMLTFPYLGEWGWTSAAAGAVGIYFALHFPTIGLYRGLQSFGFPF